MADAYSSLERTKAKYKRRVTSMFIIYDYVFQGFVRNRYYITGMIRERKLSVKDDHKIFNRRDN